MKVKRGAGIALGSVALVALGLVAGGVSPALGTNDKIYICHAAGLEGTTHYETLHLPPSAVYANAQGQGGHFFENGTTQAGHEQDYLGKCKEDETTPTETTPTETTDTTPTETTDTTPTTPTETTPTETTPTTTTTSTETTPTTPGPRCPPGMTPTAGKDGEPGNDECEFPKIAPSSTPPPAVPPAVAAAPPATTTVTSSTPPVTQPTTTTTPKPKPKPTTKPKATTPRAPKPDSPPVAKVAHVCKPLADGTKRRWYEGGNGLKAGCYAVVSGSG